MSKQNFFSRYNLILKKLKPNAYYSFEEVKEYIEQEAEHLRAVDDRIDIAFCKRTFQRDIKEIRDIFGIDIEFSRSNKGYFIKNSERADQSFQRMMEAFDVFNILNVARDYEPYIHFEQRRPHGTNFLQGIIHAVQNKVKVAFRYRKFWDEELTDRVVSPYAVKEFRDRWYMLAKDDKDGEIKTFGMDRISGFWITKKKFEVEEGFDLERFYKNAFGIMSSANIAPQAVILSFTPFQGKYIKSLPLHHSQEIIEDNDDGLQIGLRLCITHDFVMELLSFGSNVKVIYPPNLVEQVRNEHKAAYDNYI
jgi:predicted DNA-binding transcriptional regulator YafY